jgi:hypothetical protein
MDLGAMKLGESASASYEEEFCVFFGFSVFGHGMPCPYCQNVGDL